MRKITVATDIGFKKIPGANHDRPTNHFKMTPGTAWKKKPDGTWEPAEVDEKLCKKATQAFILFWIDGQTVTEFKVGEDAYAQPIVADPRAKDDPLAPKKRGRAKSKQTAKPRREAPGVAPEAPAAEPPKGKAKERTPPVEKAPSEPKAKGLRKKPLDLGI